MDMLKMMIADPSEDFRTALANSLTGKYQMELCRDGFEALEKLHSFQPDILVLDLMLPGMDGISILHAAADGGPVPAVLVTTRYVSDYILDSLEQLGVSYLMTKPCDVKSTAARIGDIAQRLRTSVSPQSSPAASVTGMLLELGVPTKLHGYCYLKEAVVLQAADQGQSVTKELYPAVAAKWGATSAQVERAIRSAIAAAWEKRDEEIWRRYFSVHGSDTVSRPTNSAFISCLASALLYAPDMEIAE